MKIRLERLTIDPIVLVCKPLQMVQQDFNNLIIILRLLLHDTMFLAHQLHIIFEYFCLYILSLELHLFVHFFFVFVLSLGGSILGGPTRDILKIGKTSKNGQIILFFIFLISHVYLLHAKLYGLKFLLKQKRWEVLQTYIPYCHNPFKSLILEL